MPMSPPVHNAAKVKAKRKASQRQYDRVSRKNNKFYNSTAWRKVRANFVKSNPVCVDCLAIGRVTPVDVVDHIEEINDGGATLDPANLQSLCHAHHNKKSSAHRVGRVKSL